LNRRLHLFPDNVFSTREGTWKMENKNKLEDIPLGLAGLMLLEAIGLQFAHTETLGAVIALFAAALVASVTERMKREPKR
jgi:hypothetical protein